MAKILVVDDEEQVCMTLRDMFEIEGFTVDTTDNVPDALHLAINGEYDVIIMDVRMPDMNGLEGLRSIKLVRQNQDILVLTGMSTPAMRELSISAGAVECLFKPKGLRDIRKIVKELVSHKTGHA